MVFKMRCGRPYMLVRWTGLDAAALLVARRWLAARNRRRLCLHGASSHEVTYTRQTSGLRGTADTLLRVESVDAASYGPAGSCSRRPRRRVFPTPRLSLVGGSSQLQRLATGRAAVTNGHSQRMFC